MERAPPRPPPVDEHGGLVGTKAEVPRRQITVAETKLELAIHQLIDHRGEVWLFGAVVHAEGNERIVTTEGFEVVFEMGMSSGRQVAAVSTVQPVGGCAVEVRSAEHSRVLAESSPDGIEGDVAPADVGGELLNHVLDFA